jgi:hypothetical protein
MRCNVTSPLCAIFKATRAKIEPSARLHVFAFAAERGGFGKTKRADSHFSLPAPEVVRIHLFISK